MLMDSVASVVIFENLKNYAWPGYLEMLSRVTCIWVPVWMRV